MSFTGADSEFFLGGGASLRNDFNFVSRFFKKAAGHLRGEGGVSTPCTPDLNCEEYTTR